MPYLSGTTEVEGEKNLDEAELESPLVPSLMEESDSSGKDRFEKDMWSLHHYPIPALW